MGARARAWANLSNRLCAARRQIALDRARSRHGKNGRVDAEYAFIKTPRSPGDGGVEEATLRAELSVLLTLEQVLGAHPHPNVVNHPTVFHGPVVVPQTKREGEMFFIATPDACRGGDLHSYIVRLDDAGEPVTEAVPEDFARLIFRDVVSGVAHLHAHGFFHQDIKLENIVVDHRGWLKLTDYGHVKQASTLTMRVLPGCDKPVFTATGAVGSQPMMPPEVVADDATPFDVAKVDVFQCGVLLFLLVGIDAVAQAGHGMCMVRKSHALLDVHADPSTAPQHERFWALFRRSRVVFPASPQLYDLLNRLLNRHPAGRPTAEEILRHPWMQGPVPDGDTMCQFLAQRRRLAAAHGRRLRRLTSPP